MRRRAPIKEFVDGDGFLYLGKSHRLRLVDQQFADLSLTAGRFLLRRSRLQHARETYVIWYSRNALSWFKLKFTEYARHLNVEIAEVRIQDLGFRWGSFSPDGRVQFHWKAILLPPRIAEYIVVHELAHANHPNHSAAFWHQIEQHMPDWQQRKSWLAAHGVEVEGL